MSIQQAKVYVNLSVLAENEKSLLRSLLNGGSVVPGAVLGETDDGLRQILVVCMDFV